MKLFKVGTGVGVKFGYRGVYRPLKNHYFRKIQFIVCHLVEQLYSTKPTVKTKSSVKEHVLQRAILDAERITGYTSTHFNLKCSLPGEIPDVAKHLHLLSTSGHPVRRIIKMLFHHGTTNVQVQGLIVLLLSQVAGHSASCSDANAAQGRGITPRQEKLALITEMIHTANLIHKNVLNLSPASASKKEEFQDLQFGNKISILSGDYFLSNAWKELANLRNCKVFGLLIKVTSDFLHPEFLGEHDERGNALPFKGMTITDWEEKNFLSAKSLLANSCKATLELAGHEESIQARGFEFGKNVALALQAYSDLQPFIDHCSHSPCAPFDLTSLPVTFHLEEHPEVVETLRNEIGDDVNNLDFKSLHQSVMEGKGIGKTKNLLQAYSETAEHILSEFNQSAASKALSNIIMALKL